MVVMPVNGLNSAYRANSYMSFSGKPEREKKSVRAEESADLGNKSNSLAKVPVIVLMAMTPGMLNSAQPADKEMFANATPKTVMVTQMPEDALEVLKGVETAEIAPQSTQQNNPLGLKSLGNEKVKKIVSYTDDNGEKKKLVFSSSPYNSQESVQFVHIIPSKLNDNQLFSAPVVTELIYHDLGPDKEFCSVRTYTLYKSGFGKNGKDSYIKEERIPDDIANEIIHLLTNKTEFRNHTIISYEESKSAKMEVPKWSY